MSKILGDNPFDDDGDSDGERPEPRDFASPADADDPLADEPPSRRAETVPDALPPAIDDDDVFLGGEAVVPPGEYGPPIPSLLPDSHAITKEVRELERRLRARLTPAFPIEATRRVPLEFLWKRYREFAMRDRSDVIDQYGRDPVYAAKIEPLLDFLYRRYFRVQAVDIAHVPSHGRALLVANHSGTLPYDGALLMHALRTEHTAKRDLRPLVENFVFHFPYLGTFINRIGGVRACPENAERLLADDQLVAVFPEGIKGIGKLYKDRYRLQRFGRGGFIKLALRARAPIVPVAIIGAEETHPMLGKITWFSKTAGIPYVPLTPTFPWLGLLGAVPIPAKWYVRFGEPLDVAARYGPEAAEDRLLVTRLAEQVRTSIQAMVDEMLAHRQSVVFG
jgi:1-acyl-sn-glycerol-3-phosphate acyltransferase